MKKNYLAVLLGALALAAAGTGIATESSVEMGKKLFNDPSLGGSPNEVSCASCHPDGQKLENAGGKDNLAQMINMCIKGPLKGEPLDDNSTEMESLRQFIGSLKK